MSTIIDDLGRDHARFRRYLTAYKEEIKKLADGLNADFGLLERLAKYFSQFPDELHHKKEDIIYTRIEEKTRNKRRALADLHAQHEELSHRARHFANIMKSVLKDQELPVAQIVDAAENYTTILTAHMQNEEETLFDPARRLFNDNDWAYVNEQVSNLYALDINFEKARQVLEIEKLLDQYLE